jgi:hypothetical protein
MSDSRPNFQSGRSLIRDVRARRSFIVQSSMKPEPDSVTDSRSRENYQWMVQSRRLIKLTTSCVWGEKSTAARLSPRLLQAKRARLLSPSPQMTSDPSSPVLRLDPTTHTMANRGNHFSSCISQSTRNFPRNDQQKPMPTRKPHRQQLGGLSPQPPELLKVSPVPCV